MRACVRDLSCVYGRDWRWKGGYALVLAVYGKLDRGAGDCVPGVPVVWAIQGVKGCRLDLALLLAFFLSCRGIYKFMRWNEKKDLTAAQHMIEAALSAIPAAPVARAAPESAEDILARAAQYPSALSHALAARYVCLWPCRIHSTTP